MRLRQVVLVSVLTAALIGIGGCARQREPSVQPPSTASTTATALTTAATRTTLPPGTVPEGPPLCDHLSDTEASAALGFEVSALAGATSITCVYTSSASGHLGTVLALSVSDSGDDLGRLLAAARSAASMFEEVEGLGDGAYVAVVDGLPQAALIIQPRQYSLTLAAAPRPLDPAVAKRALLEMIETLSANLE